MDLAEKMRGILMDLLELSELHEEDDLLEKGLDSIKIIQLIVELEEEFEFEFSDEDLIIDNFKTIRSILQIIDKKIAIKANM